MARPKIKRARRPRKRELARVARKFGDLHVKKGDTVKVLTGKDRGKTGKVLEVYKAKGRLLVEGANLVKRHQRPTQQMQKGGIIEKESSLHTSNVLLVCQACNQATRTRWERLSEGKRVRVCRKCSEHIDKV